MEILSGGDLGGRPGVLHIKMSTENAQEKSVVRVSHARGPRAVAPNREESLSGQG